MRTYPVAIGEPAPWFHVDTDINPRFAVDTVAGRYVVLSFLGSVGDAFSRTLLQVVERNQDRFSGFFACFFAVSNDPLDREQDRVLQVPPGIRAFWDFDNQVAQEFGLIDASASPEELKRMSFVLDTRLRCIRRFPFVDDPEEHAAAILGALDEVPPIEPPRMAADQAPVLVVPRIFEPELCERLIELHETSADKHDSGFMTERNGQTVELKNDEFKKRVDVVVEDQQLRNFCMHRIHDRLAPEIKKAFQFAATRMERYLIACYEADSGGHFNSHRDNTTKGTAHRRFAVSMNLNTGQYEGGYLRFPEFGSQMYEAPMGGAVVFSCSLLHEATPVIKGKRYAFLPFLYDDAAAQIRQQNLKYLATSEPQAVPVRPR